MPTWLSPFGTNTKISPIPLERQLVGVYMPPIWSCKCAQGIHQATQASSFCFKTNGFENNYLPGRHPHYVPVARPNSDSCSDSTEPIRGSVICGELRKVQFRHMPCDRVSRVRDKLTNPNYSAPKGQIKIGNIRKKCQNLIDNPNPSVRESSKFPVLFIIETFNSPRTRRWGTHSLTRVLFISITKQ